VQFRRQHASQRWGSFYSLVIFQGILLCWLASWRLTFIP
jgi:hypothetical protein